MRAIVCGARESGLSDSFVFDKLDYIIKYHPISILICGMARGIDTSAYRWALAHKIPIKPFPITKEDWDNYGNSAGPLRNKDMLLRGHAEACVYFKTNMGNGTKNMVAQSKKHGIKVICAEEFQPELMF